MKLARPFAALMIATVVAACAPRAAPVAADAPALAWEGAFGGGPGAGSRVARTQLEWAGMWQAVGQPQPQALPANTYAVEVSLGGRNTGGYGVRFESAQQQGSVFVVTWRELAPPPGVLVTQVLTEPYAVRLIPRTTLPIEVRRAP